MLAQIMLLLVLIIVDRKKNEIKSNKNNSISKKLHNLVYSVCYQNPGDVFITDGTFLVIE